VEANKIVKTGDIRAVKVPIQVVLGETQLSAQELASLNEGMIIALESFTGEPVDLVAAGQRIAKVEVVVIN